MARFVWSWSTNSNATCWWCGEKASGRVWAGDHHPMPICQSCAGALKAVLPDAPDWEREAMELAQAIEYRASWFRTDGGNNRPQRAQAILEAAQRLVEATGHLRHRTLRP